MQNDFQLRNRTLWYGDIFSHQISASLSMLLEQQVHQIEQNNEIWEKRNVQRLGRGDTTHGEGGVLRRWFGFS